MEFIKTGRICLEGMHFHAFHGVYPVEKLRGNEFLVEVSFEIDIRKAALSDKLEDTIDYSAVYNIVAGIMQTPSNLLEHVASKTLTAIKTAYPSLGALEIKIKKMNPPMEGSMQSVSICIRES